MNRQQPGSPEKRPAIEEPRPSRPYEAPVLQEYGSLKELTRTLSTQDPGDGFGASFAT